MNDQQKRAALIAALNAGLERTQAARRLAAAAIAKAAGK